MTTEPLNRLERKVDDLTDAVTKLVLFEERQTVQAATIITLSARVETSERKLEMWINRGVGIWMFAAAAFAVFKTFYHPA